MHLAFLYCIMTMITFDLKTFGWCTLHTASFGLLQIWSNIKVVSGMG